jgi:lysophospholipid acyltransferase (LPLAT)-like uncharacterized protein
LKKVAHYLSIKLAWLIILFLGKTGRIRYVNRGARSRARKGGRPVIYVLWHGRMLLPIFAHRQMNICAMVSEHDDGEIIARTIERLGYSTVRGSSTRGGSRAFRQMLRRLRRGQSCAVLPDGPNGPAYEFKMGAVLLAQRSGAHLLPMTFSTRRPIVLRSWDSFTLWKPFSKVVHIYGEPIKVPRNISPAELENHRRDIEERMNELQKRGDGFFRK